MIKLENLPVGTQLIATISLLVILFFAVRFNNKNNRKKRLKKSDFKENIQKRKKEN